MPTPSFHQPVKADSILVFRALMIGDMLCAVPALRALRHAYPAARITLAGMPWARELLDYYPQYISDFIPFPGFPGMPEAPPDGGAYREFIRHCREQGFDLAVQMHGDGRLTNGIVRRIGAAHTAGFRPGESGDRTAGRFMPWPEDGHEVHRLLGLMEFIGVPARGDHLEFPLSDSDGMALFHRGDARALRRGEYLCIHPGARLASRRWPPERFARVADALHAMGLAVVLTGAASERRLTAEVASRMRAPAHDFCGKTTLRETAALLRSARLVICNDTGISHLAAAVGARSLVLVMGSDPQRWAPSPRSRHRALYHPIDCRPCSHDHCPIGHRCATAISVQQVTAAARRIADGACRHRVAPVFQPPSDQTRPLCGPYEF